jgi:exonuclease III
MVKGLKECKASSSKLKKLKIFHQNIRGLRSKYKELLCHLEEQVPQILCFTEHHLCKEELTHLSLVNYTLGAYYCRSQYKKGGTCTYLLKSLIYETINLDKFCHDKDIEACAISINTISCRLCILAIYRSPSNNYDNFLDQIELMLHRICIRNVTMILCGDFNVNYMKDCNKKVKLDDVLAPLISRVLFHFPLELEQSRLPLIIYL